MAETAQVPVKRNWKKILLIVGIIFVLIVAVIVGVKLVKIIKNNRILDKEKKGQGSGSGSASSSGSSQGSAGDPAPPPPPQSQGVKTAYKDLKVGDKLYAITRTYLYLSPTNYSQYIICAPGEWVGQVAEKSSSFVRVKNFSVRWGNLEAQYGKVYDFYLPVKDYLVKN